MNKLYMNIATSLRGQVKERILAPFSPSGPPPIGARVSAAPTSTSPALLQRGEEEEVKSDQKEAGGKRADDWDQRYHCVGMHSDGHRAFTTDLLEAVASRGGVVQRVDPPGPTAKVCFSSSHADTYSTHTSSQQQQQQHQTHSTAVCIRWMVRDRVAKMTMSGDPSSCTKWIRDCLGDASFPYHHPPLRTNCRERRYHPQNNPFASPAPASSATLSLIRDLLASCSKEEEEEEEEEQEKDTENKKKSAMPPETHNHRRSDDDDYYYEPIVFSLVLLLCCTGIEQHVKQFVEEMEEKQQYGDETQAADSNENGTTTTQKKKKENTSSSSNNNNSGLGQLSDVFRDPLLLQYCCGQKEKKKKTKVQTTATEGGGGEGTEGDEKHLVDHADRDSGDGVDITHLPTLLWATLGSPSGLHLRNLAWHGYLLPGGPRRRGPSGEPSCADSGSDNNASGGAAAGAGRAAAPPTTSVRRPQCGGDDEGEGDDDASTVRDLALLGAVLFRLVIISLPLSEKQNKKKKKTDTKEEEEEETLGNEVACCVKQESNSSGSDFPLFSLLHSSRHRQPMSERNPNPMASVSVRECPPWLHYCVHGIEYVSTSLGCPLAAVALVFPVLEHALRVLTASTATASLPRVVPSVALEQQQQQQQKEPPREAVEKESDKRENKGGGSGTVHGPADDQQQHFSFKDYATAADDRTFITFEDLLSFHQVYLSDKSTSTSIAASMQASAPQKTAASKSIASRDSSSPSSPQLQPQPQPLSNILVASLGLDSFYFLRSALLLTPPLGLSLRDRIAHGRDHIRDLVIVDHTTVPPSSPPPATTTAVPPPPTPLISRPLSPRTAVAGCWAVLQRVAFCTPTSEGVSTPSTQQSPPRTQLLSPSSLPQLARTPSASPAHSLLYALRQTEGALYSDHSRVTASSNGGGGGGVLAEIAAGDDGYSNLVGGGKGRERRRTKRRRRMMKPMNPATDPALLTATGVGPGGGIALCKTGLSMVANNNKVTREQEGGEKGKGGADQNGNGNTLQNLPSSVTTPKNTENAEKQTRSSSDCKAVSTASPQIIPFSTLCRVLRGQQVTAGAAPHPKEKGEKGGKKEGNETQHQNKNSNAQQSNCCSSTLVSTMSSNYNVGKGGVIPLEAVEQSVLEHLSSLRCPFDSVDDDDNNIFSDTTNATVRLFHYYNYDKYTDRNNRTPIDVKGEEKGLKENNKDGMDENKKIYNIIQGLGLGSKRPPDHQQQHEHPRDEGARMAAAVLLCEALDALRHRWYGQLIQHRHYVFGAECDDDEEKECVGAEGARNQQQERTVTATATATATAAAVTAIPGRSLSTAQRKRLVVQYRLTAVLFEACVSVLLRSVARLCLCVESDSDHDEPDPPGVARHHSSTLSSGSSSTAREDDDGGSSVLMTKTTTTMTTYSTRLFASIMDGNYRCGKEREALKVKQKKIVAALAADTTKLRSFCPLPSLSVNKTTDSNNAGAASSSSSSTTSLLDPGAVIVALLQCQTSTTAAELLLV